MAILSKVEWARTIDAMQSDGLLYFHEDGVQAIVDTLNAMTAALEAWQKWQNERHGASHPMGYAEWIDYCGELFARAIELTRAAGIEWSEDSGSEREG